MDWLSLLRKAVQVEGSQAAVARRIGYSPAAVSTALGGNYNGGTDAIRDKVLEIYGGRTLNKKPVPEGYMRNHRGHLVLTGDVSALDIQRDQLVREMLAQAKVLAEAMAEAKRRWLESIQAHVQLAAEQYHVKVVGASGNVTMMSFDGSIKIERQYSRQLVANERVTVAKELVERYVNSVSAELDAVTKNLIRAALRVDEKGNFSASALLSLARRIKSTAPEWQAAVAAINDAVTTEYGEPYVRFYERDEHDNYQQIPLDFSGV